MFAVASASSHMHVRVLVGARAGLAFVATRRRNKGIYAPTSQNLNYLLLVHLSHIVSSSLSSLKVCMGRR